MNKRLDRNKDPKIPTSRKRNVTRKSENPELKNHLVSKARMISEETVPINVRTEDRATMTTKVVTKMVRDVMKMARAVTRTETNVTKETVNVEKDRSAITETELIVIKKIPDQEKEPPTGNGRYIGWKLLRTFTLMGYFSVLSDIF